MTVVLFQKALLSIKFQKKNPKHSRSSRQFLLLNCELIAYLLGLCVCVCKREKGNDLKKSLFVTLFSWLLLLFSQLDYLRLLLLSLWVYFLYLSLLYRCYLYSFTSQLSQQRIAHRRKKSWKWFLADVGRAQKKTFAICRIKQTEKGRRVSVYGVHREALDVLYSALLFQ